MLLCRCGFEARAITRPASEADAHRFGCRASADGWLSLTANDLCPCIGAIDRRDNHAVSIRAHVTLKT